MSKVIYKNIIKNKSKTALIMCTYIRLENLQHTFTSLINQTNKDFDFYICDNSNNNEKLLKIINKHSLDFNLSIYDYGNNFKQFARFIVAQDLAKDGYERVIFIDDDQILPETFIQDCYEQYENDCVKSFWSHKIEKIYKSKIKLERDELGNYAGTGGLVCSASIFLDEFFFTCPEQFWIIDDLWLSYYILKYTDLKIKTLNTKISFIIDKKATHLFLKEVKQNFAEQFIIPNSKHIPSLL